MGLAAGLQSNTGPARPGCSGAADQTQALVHSGPGLGWPAAGLRVEPPLTPKSNTPVKSFISSFCHDWSFSFVTLLDR
jgi:hypothetical protein